MTSLYNLFKYHFCLKSVPAMEVLEFMSRRTRNSDEKAELIRLASDYNAYNAWRQDCHGIVHLFKQFPSLQVTATVCFRDLAKPNLLMVVRL
jgi:sulfite reductase alpha subunit-like flavoprotein